jgi:hypothetical protein
MSAGQAVLIRPNTKESGRNEAASIWAFAAPTVSPDARAHYDRRRGDGDGHAAAQRNLFGRLFGCLWHFLTTGQHYDEATASPHARTCSQWPDNTSSPKLLDH